MEMHQIKYFIAVSKQLNFSRAARMCKVSTPSLCRAIRLLEDELGGNLFNREGRYTHLTELGRRLLPLLENGYSNITDAKTIAKSIRVGERKPVVIAATPAMNISQIHGVLTTLHSSHPQVEIHYQRLRANDSLEGLRNGSFDLAILPDVTDSWDRLERWQLGEHHLSAVLSGSHRLASRTSVTCSELTNETLIVMPDCEQAQKVISSVNSHSRTVSKHQVFSELDALGLVELNLGVALLPHNLEVRTGIRRLKIENAPGCVMYAYAVSGRPRSSALQAFVNVIARESKANARRLDERQPLDGDAMGF